MRLAVCFAVVIPALFAQSAETFDIFQFSAPAGWKVERTEASVAMKKDTGARYCNSYLFRSRPSAGSHATDVAANWRSHAAKHGLTKPESVNTFTTDGWEVTTGAGTARFQNQRFLVVVSTRTGYGLAYSLVHYFSDPGFGEELAALTKSIAARPPVSSAPLPQTAPAGMTMTKFNTNFDDGWVATVTPAYVQATRSGTEARLYYMNDALEKGRPNTVDVPEYYWARVVQPAFRTSAPQKWVGVTYPPVYLMQGNAVDPRTGRACYVAMKVIYAGGARVVVVVSPNQSTFQQQFPQPNDMDRLINYNKFSVTARDIVGTWVRNAGGGVEYYNAYTGNYAGMSANSTSDEFVFLENGTYKSTHRYANTTNGATKFNGLDYQGRFTVSDWEVLAGNRVDGKTKKFRAQLEAIQNGYLLILTDSDYDRLQYVLYRQR